MPPFQYTPFNAAPYVSSVAELLAHGNDAQARAAAAIGAAHARATEVSGQAWAGAAQNIGASIAAIPGQIAHAKETQQRGQLVDQQLKSGAITLAEQQKKQADDETMSRIYQGAYGAAPSQQPGFQGPTQPGSPAAGTAPSPDGLPPGMEKGEDGVISIKPDYLTQAMAAAGMGDKIPAVLATQATYKEKAATLAKTRGEVAVQTRDSLGALGATVEAAGNTPQAFHTAGLLAVHNGQLTPQQLKPYLDLVDQNPDAVKTITQQLQTGSKAQTELNTSRATADARTSTAATAATRLLHEFPSLDAKGQEAARGNASAILGAAQSQAEYASALDQLPHALARQFPAADSWTPKTADTVRQLGMTADQQATTTGAAAGRAETLRQHNFENYLAGLRNKREDAKFNLTFGSGLGEDGKPLPPEAIRAAADANPAAKMIANYDIAPPSTRNLSDPKTLFLLKQVQALNPDYDASQFSVRAPTRKAYTIGVQGQQLTAMNTAIEHLDQLQAAADALHNGNFKPGNAAFNYLKDAFGSGAPTSFATIKEKVDKELDAVASKGVPTVSGAAAQKEIGGASNSPESVKAYIDTSIKLLASSQNALRAPYQRAMGANAPFDPLTPEAKAVLTKRGFDPAHGTLTAAAGAVPSNVAAALKGATAGVHTLSDGSTWTINADGTVTKGR